MADNITTAVQSEVSALAHKHVSVTYAVLSVLVLVIALMGLGGYLALKSFDKQLAAQNARDAQYQQDRTLWQAQVAQHDTERAQQALQISQLQDQIAKRDSKPLPKEVQAGLKPDATAETVAKAVTESYKSNPAFGQATATPGGQVSLSVPQAQATVEAKVGFDKASADLADEKSMVSLLNGTNLSLTNDLNQCKLLNTKAEADIAGYKKLAMRSKWQKFLGGMEKVALVAVGFELGHKL
jgi:hypothetical protein